MTLPTPSEATKKYILFDLDGTLTDPALGICTCAQVALASEGIEEPDLKKLEKFIGPPLKGSFMEFYGLDDAAADRAVAKYRERFGEVGYLENKVYPGIGRMLKELKEAGLKLGIASSKPQEYVERILKHFRLDKYFDVVAGSSMNDPSENKATSIRRALDAFRKKGSFSIDEVYLVGDRSYDTEGAHTLGMECVGVAYGYGSLEELHEAHTDYIVFTVDELRRFLLRERPARALENSGKSKFGYAEVWALLYVFLGFVVIRSVVQYGFGFLLTFPAQSMGDGLKRVIYVLNEAGEIVGFSGNTAVFLGGLGFLGGVCFLWKKARHSIENGSDIRRLEHLLREPFSSYFGLGLLTLGSVVGLNLLIFLTGIAQASESYSEVASAQYGCSLWLGFLVYGLVSPFAEELCFRGILQNRFRRFFPVRVTVLLSALVFSLYHGNRVQSIYAFLIGLVLAYAYEYFGTFIVPLAVHMGANLLAYGLTPLTERVPKLISWPICIAALLTAIIGGVILVMKKPKLLQAGNRK